MFKRLTAMTMCLVLCPIMPVFAKDAPDRVLVAYFSRAGENYNVGVIEKGNTEILANLIVEETGADIIAITPVTPYPEGYEDTKTIAMREYEADARPEMVQMLEDLDNYDTIFVGYPIWWGGLPMIMYTFLENFDFDGKTVIPFNTHEGSEQADTVEQIRSALPGATVLDGFAVRGETVQNDTEAARKSVAGYLASITLP